MSTIVPYLPTVGWYKSWLRTRMGAKPDFPAIHSINKSMIRGAWGEQALTVPILGGRRKLARTPYKVLRLSEHDDWRHKHWQAITSAYGSLPYFPYFKDVFAPIFLNGPVERLETLCQKLHNAFIKCCNLEDLALWMQTTPHPPLKKRQSEVPDDIAALELLFLHGPETIFYL